MTAPLIRNQSEITPALLPGTTFEYMSVASRRSRQNLTQTWSIWAETGAVLTNQFSEFLQIRPTSAKFSSELVEVGGGRATCTQTLFLGSNFEQFRSGFVQRPVLRRVLFE